MGKLDTNYFFARILPGDRVLFELIYIQVFTYAEVSHILNIPEGSLKTKARRVLQEWRSWLNLREPSSL